MKEFLATAALTCFFQFFYFDKTVKPMSLNKSSHMSGSVLFVEAARQCSILYSLFKDVQILIILAKFLTS